MRYRPNEDYDYDATACGTVTEAVISLHGQALARFGMCAGQPVTRGRKTNRKKLLLAARRKHGL